ncbi:hypothetical protein [Mucilaginibacter pedocola]|uniref:Uncharacterized protein n=1 Tax=Mucilaginibacter pedocola TaxID=1792845 RepID=A0A1S9PF17_9SPHI|nr:hypothetical protein [Mucilaginibacter pedocola]OOQ59554.1 hypothetical protein BC343_05130 [Mucilaginibacter pedocola]
MSTEKLAAQLETRIFYFTIVDQKPNQIQISMYGTPYTLIKGEEAWHNGNSNQMNMSQPLIDAVVKVVLGE